ncbi:MAG TPA: hypothetical protein VF161_00865 [Steroidobacteraceae bacterium]
MVDVKKLISRREAKALGLPRYYTGRPCLRGHIAERFAGNKTCVECDRQSPSRAKYREKRRTIVQELRAEITKWRDYAERLLDENEALLDENAALKKVLKEAQPCQAESASP